MISKVYGFQRIVSIWKNAPYRKIMGTHAHGRQVMPLLFLSDVIITFASQHIHKLLGAFLKHKMRYLMQRKKKNPLFAWGWDRKVRPSRPPFVITRQASWCQTVILGTDFSITSSHSRYILIISDHNPTYSNQRKRNQEDTHPGVRIQIIPSERVRWLPR